MNLQETKGRFINSIFAEIEISTHRCQSLRPKFSLRLEELMGLVSSLAGSETEENVDLTKENEKINPHKFQNLWR
jgi:hypothetical protein